MLSLSRAGHLRGRLCTIQAEFQCVSVHLELLIGVWQFPRTSEGHSELYYGQNSDETRKLQGMLVLLFNFDHTDPRAIDVRTLSRETSFS